MACSSFDYILAAVSIKQDVYELSFQSRTFVLKTAMAQLHDYLPHMSVIFN